MNEVSGTYVKDNLKGIAWNKETAKASVDFQFTYPHRRFNRTVGE